MSVRALALVTSVLVGCASQGALRPQLSESAPGTQLRCSAHDALAISEAGELVRGDGTTWSRVSTPANRRLRAMWGKSCHDVWVVGDGGTIVWGDGRDFWLVPSPVEAPLNAVRGTEHDDVWARTEDGTLLHFDGTRFEVAFTPPSAEPPPAQALALFR
jgi:hypothetical protein